MPEVIPDGPRVETDSLRIILENLVDTDVKTKALQTIISRLLDLESDHDSLQSDVESIRSTAEDALSEVRELSDEVDGIQVQVNDLEGRVD